MTLPIAILCNTCKEGKLLIQEKVEEQNLPTWCEAEKCIGEAQGFVISKGMVVCHNCEFKKKGYIA